MTALLLALVVSAGPGVAPPSCEVGLVGGEAVRIVAPAFDAAGVLRGTNAATGRPVAIAADRIEDVGHKALAKYFASAQPGALSSVLGYVLDASGQVSRVERFEVRTKWDQLKTVLTEPIGGQTVTRLMGYHRAQQSDVQLLIPAGWSAATAESAFWNEAWLIAQIFFDTFDVVDTLGIEGYRRGRDHFGQPREVIVGGIVLARSDFNRINRTRFYGFDFQRLIVAEKWGWYRSTGIVQEHARFLPVQD